jgi:UDP-GlcNAc:undecaprenyl-phosphate GlcNAc-1-phosphate transferase
MIPTPPSIASVGVACALAGLVAVALTPIARLVAVRLSVLDAPGRRKLHRLPVPYLGGVAVMGAVAFAWTLLRFGQSASDLPGWLALPAWVSISAWDSWFLSVSLGPWLAGSAGTGLVIGAVAMMIVGLADDVRGLSPGVRLVGEVLVVVAVLAFWGSFDTIQLGGLQFAGVVPGVALLLGAFWVLALTNAGNLMDGMDGLAAGVGAIAAAVLAYLALAVYDRPGTGLVLAMISGAYAGFLLFNTHPARIYLGDAGSLALGFVLGAGGLYATTSEGVWHVTPALLVLGVPATDVFVAMLRRGLGSLKIHREGQGRERFVFRLKHRPRFFEGDRGHLHHRLLERVGSIKAAVGILYLAALALGMLGVWAALEPALAPMLLVGSVLLGGMTVSRFLHPELRLFEQGFLLPLFHTRQASNRGLHFVYDVLVFATAFLAATWIGTRWWPTTPLDGLRVALAALTGPATMAWLGLYRIHFRRAGVWSVWKAVSAVGAGAATVLLVDTLALRMPLASATALLFIYLVLTGSVLPRAAYGFVDEAYARRPHGGRATLIVGTDRAELRFLQRILSSDDLDLRPIGFLDDAPDLDGKMLQGFPVYRAAGGEIEGLLSSLGVEVVVMVGDPSTDSRDVRHVRLHMATRATGAALLRYREALSQSVPPARTRPRAVSAAATTAVNGDRRGA